MDTIQDTSSEETTVSMGRISGKWQFLDLDTSASNTTELDPYKFTHFLLEVVRSITLQWVRLDFKFGWRGAQVEFLFSIFEAERYNSAQASTLGEKISRFRPVDPPTNDTHDGTELKKLIPAWGA